MRGTGDAQRNMDTFNSTLWDELSNAGILKMVAKSVYPLEVPQRPQDFKAAHGSRQRTPRNAASAQRSLDDGLVRATGER